MYFVRWFWLVILGAALLALPRCTAGSEIRYRITVEVNTPSGVRSNSGVWSFKLMPGNIDQSYTNRFRGEAIPVDLPNGQALYVLLNDDAAMLPEKTLPRRYLPGPADTLSFHYFPEDVGHDRMKQIPYIRKHMRGKIELDCTHEQFRYECPFLVRFRNMRDPTTVEAIDPVDLSKTFGRGYSLKGIYLQVTDESPTHQLGDRLPWENDTKIKVGHLDGSGSSNHSSLANRLSLYNFKRWRH